MYVSSHDIVPYHHHHWVEQKETEDTTSDSVSKTASEGEGVAKYMQGFLEKKKLEGANCAFGN